MAFMNANCQNHIFINLQERYFNQNLILIEEKIVFVYKIILVHRVLL